MQVRAYMRYDHRTLSAFLAYEPPTTAMLHRGASLRHRASYRHRNHCENAYARLDTLLSLYVTYHGKSVSVVKLRAHGWAAFSSAEHSHRCFAVMLIESPFTQLPEILCT